MNDLHRGDLTAAVRDLGTLLSLVKLYEKDPTLVTFMIRMAMVGLSVDVCWDALQTSSWTEPQLAILRRECLDIGRLWVSRAGNGDGGAVPRTGQVQG